MLEHGDKPGRKILISGGGRCNFTNIHTAPDRFLSANPHFAKSALSRYTPADFVALVESHGIAWHETTLGQLFCDGSARQIVDMLLTECAQGGVQVTCGETVRQVEHDGTAFTVTTGGQVARAPALVIATGGPSIPKLGATGFAYQLARQFGLKVVEPRPALVPLTLSGEDALFRELSGVATHVTARCGEATFEEAALFTHRGLSNLTDAVLREAEGRLADWPFRPNGSEGFAKAEVTVGGVSTAELSSKTMEARRVPGLYVIGEGVDVTGWLGGYNFQWAWASAWAAGQAV